MYWSLVLQYMCKVKDDALIFETKPKCCYIALIQPSSSSSSPSTRSSHWNQDQLVFWSKNVWNPNLGQTQLWNVWFHKMRCNLFVIHICCFSNISFVQVSKLCLFFTSKLGQSGPRIVVSSDDQSQPKMSFTTPDYNQKYEINTKKNCGWIVLDWKSAKIASNCDKECRNIIGSLRLWFCNFCVPTFTFS